MHVFTNELSESILGLYGTFAVYKSIHVEGCPCCVDDEDKRRLLSKPLRELTTEDVTRYSWKALTTWGTVEDFKHFLPRLFELMATDECSAIEPEVLLSKLRLAEWHTWQKDERRSVAQFLDAVWQDCLTAEAGSVWVHELLCGIGHSVDELMPFLRAWIKCNNKAGYAHLVHFIDWNLATIIKRRHLRNSFWSDAPKQMMQVVDWLLNSSTAQELEDIFTAQSGSDFSSEVAMAFDRVSALQRLLVGNQTNPP